MNIGGKTPTEQLVHELACEADELFGRTIERGMALGDATLIGKTLGDLTLRFYRQEIHPSEQVMVVHSLLIGAPKVEDEEIFVAGDYVSSTTPELMQQAHAVGDIALGEDFSHEHRGALIGSQTHYDFDSFGYNSMRYRLNVGFGRRVKHAPHERIEKAREFVEKSMHRVMDDRRYLGFKQDEMHAHINEFQSFQFNPTTNLRFNGTEDADVINKYVNLMRERRADLIINARKAVIVDPTGDGLWVYKDRIDQVQAAIMAAKEYLADDGVDDNVRI